MLTSHQQSLHSRAVQLSQDYFKKEMELVSHLQSVEKNKVHLALNYSSLFQYCVTELKLPRDRAYDFITVQRKCVQVPALKQKLEAGKISLTNARRVSSVLTLENQEKWLHEAEVCSKEELEKKIAGVLPKSQRETVKILSEDRYSLSLSIDEALLKKLRRIQTLLSNRRKKAVNLEETLNFAADEVLKRIDPLLKKMPELGLDRVDKPVQEQLPQGMVGIEEKEFHERKPIPAAIKTAVLQRDEGKCQWKSPTTREKCGSSYFIHLHHKIPVHLGGLNTIENIVVLCSSHHQFLHDVPMMKHPDRHQKFWAMT